MSTLGSLSLFGYALFSIVGGIVFLSNRNLGRVLSSCAAVGLLLLWGWLFVRYSGADWSRLAYVFFNFEILGEGGMKALAGGFMTTLEVGIIATLCAFWLGVFLTLVRFFENKVMTGFVKVYVDVFRAPAHHRAGVPYPLRRAVHRHLPAADGIRHPDPSP